MVSSEASGGDHSRKDRQMQARDHQQMKRACPFKPGSQAMPQVGAVSGDHGGEHRGIFAANAKPCRKVFILRIFREAHQLRASLLFD
jgi:hypothetical protein